MALKSLNRFLWMPLAMALVGACTKDVGSQSKSANPIPEKTILIESVGEQMKFNREDLYVKAGDTITLTFRNVSSTLAHNWVLVKPGKEDEVANLGTQAGPEKNYVPLSNPEVIAFTRLVPPKGQKYIDKIEEASTGETSITFKAPVAGDYPFICTNAGHYTVMKGILHSMVPKVESP